MKTNLLKILFGGLLGVSCISAAALTVTHNDEQVKVSASDFDVDTYYASANTGSAQNLLDSLRSIINANYKTLGYDGLLEAYHTTDKRPDGYLKDYYSNITNYVIGGPAENAQYKKEGDGYNREHAIPQSWWGKGTTNQGCDAFIVLPTDGYINNMRSNWPFGEVASVSKQSANGFSLFGTGKNNIGTCFEPNDMYKGDFARIYFYAITKWKTTTWTGGNASSTFLTSLSAPNWGLTNYALDLFVRWHAEDPVDEWELNRNDNVFALQKNRNPYIDHPEWVDIIWGGTYPGSKELVSLSTSGTPNKLTYVAGEAFDPTGLTITATFDDGSTNDVTSKVTWSPITSSTTSVTGTYKYGSISKTVTVNGIKIKTVNSLSMTGTASKLHYLAGQSFDPTGLTIKAVYSDSSDADVTKSVTWAPSPLYEGVTSVTGSYGGKTIKVEGLSVEASHDYTLVNSTSELADGDKVVFAYDAGGITAGQVNASKTCMETVNSTFSSGKITSLGSGTTEMIAKKDGNSWIFTCGNQKLSSSGAKKIGWDDGSTTWTVSVSNGNAEITNTTTSYGTIKYNKSADMFRTYTSGQLSIQIYHMAGGDSSKHVENVTLNETEVAIIPGNTYQLTATISPKDATNKDVTWTTSNSNVATVDSNGLVTGVSEGSATITVTTNDGGFTAICEITVSHDAPTPTPTPKKGCPGSVVGASVIMFTVSLLGFGLLISKKFVK